MAGRITGGKKLKAVIPGGSSCPLLNRRRDRYSDGLRFGGQSRSRCLGSGGMVVMDEDTCIGGHGAANWWLTCAHESVWMVHPLPRRHPTWLRKMLLSRYACRIRA